jgi:hypothetical protein
MIRLTAIFLIADQQSPDAGSVWLLCSRGGPRSNNWEHLELMDLLQTCSQAGFHDDIYGFAIAEAKFGITVNQATHFELNDAEIIPGRSNGLSWVLRRVPYSWSKCTVGLSSDEWCEPM